MPRRRPNPAKPRRPTNAFILWLPDNKERLKRDHPEMRRFNRLTPIAAQEWSRLTADQKQHYSRAAEVEKQRYRNAMQLYDRQRGAQQPTMQTAMLPLQQDSDPTTAVPCAHDHTASQPPALEASVESVYLYVPGSLPTDFKCPTCPSQPTPAMQPQQQGLNGGSVYITSPGQPQQQAATGTDNTISTYATGPGISVPKASTTSIYINPAPAPNSVFVQLPSVPRASKPSNDQK